MFPDTYDVELVRRSLRPVRLYHWMQVLEHRRLAKSAEAQESNLGLWIAASHEKVANEHISHVQSLNEFFEIGDTAERDQIAMEAANPRT